jgi:enamine deaminase RidA (YjgF/YER057c/UK114 family)
MGGVESRLAGLGLALPGPPIPVGNYVPAARAGNLVFTSGQTARLDGVRHWVGVVGRDVTPAEARLSARDSTLNCLACVKAIAGSLDCVVRVVRVVGFVNAVEGYEDHADAMEGAGDLLVALFDERGRAACTTFGVNALPSNVSVEIELVVEVQGDEDIRSQARTQDSGCL